MKKEYVMILSVFFTLVVAAGLYVVEFGDVNLAPDVEQYSQLGKENFGEIQKATSSEKTHQVVTIEGRNYVFDSGSSADDSRIETNFLSNQIIQQQLGYLVKLSEQPLLLKRDAQNPLSVQAEEIEFQKSRINTQKETFSRNLKDVSLDGRVTKSVESVANVVLITGVSQSELADIKALPEVVEVYPNSIYSTTLSESVPFIGANDVWELDHNGNPCSSEMCDLQARNSVSLSPSDKKTTETSEEKKEISEKTNVEEKEESSPEENKLIDNSIVEDSTSKNMEEKNGAETSLENDESLEKSTNGDNQVVVPSQKTIQQEEFQIEKEVRSCQGGCLTGTGITIGIIDTGVDYTHPDLGGCFGEGCKVIGGYDFVNDDNDPMDDHGHGTHVAATAAGNGVLKGVAPGASIVGYKVLNSGGSGSSMDILQAIERSVDPNEDGDFSDHLDVISLSLGRRCSGSGDDAYDFDCGPDDLLSSAIDSAVANGVVAVIAAGNSGPDFETIGSPGTARSAITVGATTKFSPAGITDFSSRGPIVWEDEEGIEKFLVKPEIVAPGYQICAAQWEDAWGENECIDDEHTSISGTSMAAPHISGVVALMLQKNPDLSPEMVKSSLMQNSEFIYSSINFEEPDVEIDYSIFDQGAGLVNTLDSVFSNQHLFVGSLETILDGVSLTVRGNIDGGSFESYTISYARYEDELSPEELSWIEIYSQEDIQSNNVLLEDYDISNFQDGKYLVRLIARDIQGNKYKSFGYFEHERFRVISPLTGDRLNPLNDNYLIIESSIPLSSENFLIEYALQPYDPFEETEYIIHPITDFEVDGSQYIISLDGDLFEYAGYQFKITISTPQFSETLYTNYVTFDPNLHEGWPVRIPIDDGLFFHGHLEPSLADIDSDGINEVFVYANGNLKKLYGFNSVGEMLPGWPKEIGPFSGYNLQGSPVFSNIDEDPEPEIFIAHTDKVLILDTTTDSIDEIQIPGIPVWGSDFIVSDINFDGSKEIILIYSIISEGQIGFPQGLNLAIFDLEGEMLPGWPKEVYDFRIPGTSVTLICNSITGSPSPTLGNFDDDEELEIVVANFRNVIYDTDPLNFDCASSVFAYNLDGSSVDGFPVELDETVEQTPITADVDGDSFSEIALAMGGTNYILDDDATVILESSGSFSPSGPIAIDADRNGIPDFMFSQIDSAKIYDGFGNSLASIFDYLGTFRSPAYPHLLNDEYIFIPSKYVIYSLDFSLETLPLSRGFENSAPPPTGYYGDVDEDGKFDIVISSNYDNNPITSESKDRASVYRWEFDDLFVGDGPSWPMHAHDLERTNCYDCHTQCSDGIDNDEDFAIDCEDVACQVDGVCDPTIDDENRIRPECQDGIDNDSDGLLDLEDPDCEGIVDDSETGDGPDLAITSLETVTGACKMQGGIEVCDVRADIEVTNIGNEVAGESQLVATLLGDAFASSRSNTVAQRESGESLLVRPTFRDVPTGESYVLSVSVDAQDQIDESNENNNGASTNVLVVEP